MRKELEDADATTLDAVLAHLDRHDPGEVVGLYLFGSAVESGLRPHSDLDLLVLTRRSLTEVERREMVGLLLAISGWSGHAAEFPDATSRRPVELTSVVLVDDRPWAPPATVDLQYGEWLRNELVAGAVPRPHEDPDLTIVLAAARHRHLTLRGPALDGVIAAVPVEFLQAAIRQRVPELLDGFEGDVRNTLLTLARAVVAGETGVMVSKQEAAIRLVSRLPVRYREVLTLARAGYLGEAIDDWTDRLHAARATADHLANLIDARTGRGR